MAKTNSAFTLMELLVAMILMGLVVVAFSSLDTFSHYQLISTDRRSRLQNEVSITLDRMKTLMGLATGNEIINGNNSVISLQGGNRVLFRVDSDNDGITETWRAFGRTNNQVRYCGNCANAACALGVGGCVLAWETVSDKIVTFTPTKPSSPLRSNYIDVLVTACWNPLSVPPPPLPNGTPDNPCVSMRSRINMPSVSTQ